MTTVVCMSAADIYYDLSADDDYTQVRNSRNFTGKVVLITGSNSGIGESVAKLFSALGAHVVITGKNEVEIKRVVQEAQKLSPTGLVPLGVAADLLKTADLEKLVSETIKTFGKLDVLVNNAGASLSTHIRDANFIEVFDTLINLNTRAGLQLIHLAVPHLEKTNGTIISTSSIWSSLPGKASIPYGVSKVALDFATRALAIELGPKIRVNAINPGWILTENLKHHSTPAELADAAAHTPLKRIGQPIDVAKGVVFLASTDAQFITGANLVTDGGIVYNS
ncbi:unnamed protein product [Medioppia subpectinata]|uniref:Uncharacterized protein n=1 Tax=Medioppia subpectinata TaxID=1979941 RepID=A0A7R9L4T8_9ACAR|nr:unnamed protein product [Medioppia subpectinata]CAG2114293.1 unnamed protein product [Medioppia subpectinata]